MAEIVYGQPNLYFLFMAMGSRLLKQGGEFIYIVPRSFTSGLYFSVFRKWFIDEMKITDLHIFTLRDEVFQNDGILQETVVLRAVKTNRHIDRISITESTNSELQPINKIFVDYDICVSKNKDCFLYLPSNQEDIEVLNFINQWEYTLADGGFRMKTGLVVDFRETEWLREYKQHNTLPLLWAHNLKNNRVIFPVNHKNKAQYLIDCPDTDRLKMRLDNYVILKRFTSKEEKKRLQCSVLLKNDFENYPAISTENHLNFITKINGNMTEEDMFGIFAVLNSSYMDRYFRILNGSTQVNANEINSLPFPSHGDIIDIGRVMMNSNDLSETVCDYILDSKYKPAGVVAV
jgi:adenine-specific DNA-methyltransferase